MGEVKRMTKSLILEYIRAFYPDATYQITMGVFHDFVNEMVDELIKEGKIEWTTKPKALTKKGRIDERFSWIRYLKVK